jgi:hypothetical protein
VWVVCLWPSVSEMKNWSRLFPALSFIESGVVVDILGNRSCIDYSIHVYARVCFFVRMVTSFGCPASLYTISLTGWSSVYLRPSHISSPPLTSPRPSSTRTKLNILALLNPHRPDHINHHHRRRDPISVPISIPLRPTNNHRNHHHHPSPPTTHPRNYRIPPPPRTKSRQRLHPDEGERLQYCVAAGRSGGGAGSDG